MSVTKKRRKRRRHSDDFKRKVVAYRQDHGFKETAAKFEISEGTLGKWQKDRALQPSSNGTPAGQVEKSVEKTRRQQVGVSASTDQYPAEPFSMVVSVPEGGLVLKVRDADHAMIGTLNLSQDGVQFIQSNAKKQPDKYLPWETFHNLMVSGLLG